jgi:arylsulfatase A-like enzyme
VEFYDLKRDPWEQHNVAADPSYKDALNKLRGLLLSHMEQTNDPLLKGAVTSPMHNQGADWLRKDKEI